MQLKSFDLVFDLKLSKYVFLTENILMINQEEKKHSLYDPLLTS